MEEFAELWMDIKISMNDNEIKSFETYFKDLLKTDKSAVDDTQGTRYSNGILKVGIGMTAPNEGHLDYGTFHSLAGKVIQYLIENISYSFTVKYERTGASG